MPPSLHHTHTSSNTDSFLADNFNVPPPYIPSYSRVSSFRSPQLEVLLYSPSVKTVSTAWTTHRTIPVYGDHDVVGGKIMVDPSCRSGRVILTISGTFVRNTMPKDTDKLPYERPEQQRHIFFFESSIINVSSPDPAPSRSVFRRVFRRNRRNGLSINSLDSATRTFPFAFDLALSQRSGEVIPSTCCSSDSTAMPFEITYQVAATWEPSKITEKSSLLTIPIVIEPDPDFRSQDDIPESQISWVEIPLKAHRPLPFQCAVTLPGSLSFSRTSSIPFFVVFTTIPRSTSLTREIATDATISVVVSSEMTVTEDDSCTSTPSTLESPVSDDSSKSRFKTKVLKRIKSSTSLFSSQSSESGYPSQKALPPLPMAPVFATTKLVYSGISLGFPKRPRHRLHDQKSHPSLDAHHSLPDGLHKGKIPLKRNMHATFDWSGISLKYFLEVSVLVGQDELRTKIMLRIT
ncbi:hypothetical protein C8R44DRAFT_661566 [Mycena epipterygia]|nr:hypothetical protein C8R44DRAFT_661566 [Mycena epipterygia]